MKPRDVAPVSGAAGKEPAPTLTLPVAALAGLTVHPPPDQRRARSSSKPGDVVVVASAVRMTPDEVEAIAQRLAALLLRAP